MFQSKKSKRLDVMVAFMNWAGHHKELVTDSGCIIPINCAFSRMINAGSISSCSDALRFSTPEMSFEKVTVVKEAVIEAFKDWSGLDISHELRLLDLRSFSCDGSFFQINTGQRKLLFRSNGEQLYKVVGDKEILLEGRVPSCFESENEEGC